MNKEKMIRINKKILTEKYPIDRFDELTWMVLFFLYGSTNEGAEGTTANYSKFIELYPCHEWGFINSLYILNHSGLITLSETGNNRIFKDINYKASDYRSWNTLRKSAYFEVLQSKNVPLIRLTLIYMDSFSDEYPVYDGFFIRKSNGDILVADYLPKMIENSLMSIEEVIASMLNSNFCKVVIPYNDDSATMPDFIKGKVEYVPDDDDLEDRYRILLHPGTPFDKSSPRNVNNLYTYNTDIIGKTANIVTMPSEENHFDKYDF